MLAVGGPSAPELLPECWSRRHHRVIRSAWSIADELGSLCAPRCLQLQECGLPEVETGGWLGAAAIAIHNVVEGLKSTLVGIESPILNFEHAVLVLWIADPASTSRDASTVSPSTATVDNHVFLLLIPRSGFDILRHFNLVIFIGSIRLLFWYLASKLLFVYLVGTWWQTIGFEEGMTAHRGVVDYEVTDLVISWGGYLVWSFDELLRADFVIFLQIDKYLSINLLVWDLLHSLSIL